MYLFRDPTDAVSDSESLPLIQGNTGYINTESLKYASCPYQQLCSNDSDDEGNVAYVCRTSNYCHDIAQQNGNGHTTRDT